MYTSVFLGFEGLNFEDGELKGEEGISKRGDDGSDNGTGDEGIDNGTGDEGEVEDVGFVLVEELRWLFVESDCVDGEVNDEALLKEEEFVFE